MTQFRQDETPQPKPFSRTLALKRWLARWVLVAEQLLPRTLLPGSIVLLFLAFAWLGFFRVAPFWLHAAALFAFLAPSSSLTNEARFLLRGVLDSLRAWGP